MLREVLNRQRTRRYARIFHVVEFTIQDNHLHLIVEATGVVATGMKDASDALRAGVSGLVISFAKQLNKLLGRRRGKVWGDRFHSRELASPTEVRNALVYVFRNLARHGTTMLGDGNVDRFSSAPRFAHFTRSVMRFDDELWPMASPRTWLLGSGWWTRTRQGPLDPNEVRRRGPYVVLGAAARSSWMSQAEEICPSISSGRRRSRAGEARRESKKRARTMTSSSRLPAFLSRTRVSVVR